MKPFLPFCLLLIVTVFLYGCPYDSPYNLDEAPQQNIDEELLGNWATQIAKRSEGSYTSKPEIVKIIFEKRTDMDYDFAVTGQIGALKPYHVVSNDSIRGTGYLSTIAGRQFLNAYIHGKVYIAEVLKDTAGISIMPLSEYFTSKLIKNSRELRAAVEFHYRMKLTPGYDAFFCLKKLRKEN